MASIADFVFDFFKALEEIDPRARNLFFDRLGTLNHLGQVVISDEASKCLWDLLEEVEQEYQEEEEEEQEQEQQQLEQDDFEEEEEVHELVQQQQQQPRGRRKQRRKQQRKKKKTKTKTTEKGKEIQKKRPRQEDESDEVFRVSPAPLRPRRGGGGGASLRTLSKYHNLVLRMEQSRRDCLVATQYCSAPPRPVDVKLELQQPFVYEVQDLEVLHFEELAILSAWRSLCRKCIRAHGCFRRYGSQRWLQYMPKEEAHPHDLHRIGEILVMFPGLTDQIVCVSQRKWLKKKGLLLDLFKTYPVWSSDLLAEKKNILQDGFEVLRVGQLPSSREADEANDYVRFNAGNSIFNGNENKRFAHPVPDLVEHPLLETVQTILKERYKHLNFKDFSIIISLAGCARQPMHGDFDGAHFDTAFETGVFEKYPLSSIFMYQDGGKLLFRECSINESKEDVRLRPMKPFTFFRGEIVVFRGDVKHAGDAYNYEHTRAHVYGDHPDLPRVLEEDMTNRVDLGSEEAL